MAKMHSNHFYNKNLQPNANRLRKELTKAEACLWKYVLRAGKLKVLSIQAAAASADFMCKEISNSSIAI